MMNTKASLLKFTIDLNRDGNLEFDLDCVDTIGMESALRKLGDPCYGHRIGNIVRQYFRTLEDRIKQEKA